MNSIKLLLSKLPYEPFSDNESMCSLCKKPVSNLLLFAHCLNHKEEFILRKSLETVFSNPPSQSITLQKSQTSQPIPRIESNNLSFAKSKTILNESNTCPKINNNLGEASLREPDLSLYENKKIQNCKSPETRLSVYKSIKISNSCHTRFRRIEITFKRCIRLQIMKGFKMFKKMRIPR